MGQNQVVSSLVFPLRAFRGKSAPCLFQQPVAGYRYSLVSDHVVLVSASMVTLLSSFLSFFCLFLQFSSVQFSSVQSLSHVWLFATPWTAARQASLSIANSWSLLKLMIIELVMPSNHLILCHPLLLLPSIFPNIRVFSSESVHCIRWPKDWSFIFNISLSNKYSGVISFRMDWLWEGNRQEGQGSPNGGDRLCQCQMFFICLKQQEETN